MKSQQWLNGQIRNTIIINSSEPGAAVTNIMLRRFFRNMASDWLDAMPVNQKPLFLITSRKSKVVIENIN